MSGTRAALIGFEQMFQNFAKRTKKFANEDYKSIVHVKSHQQASATQQLGREQLLMVHERLHEEGLGFALLFGRHGDQEEPTSLMIQGQRPLDNGQQQQLLMVQAQNDQAPQQYVIIQDRREHNQQQMVRYEYSHTNGEKEDLVQQPHRQPSESEHAQLQVVTIGSNTAAIVTPPLFYNPTALRTYPVGVSI